MKLLGISGTIIGVKPISIVEAVLKEAQNYDPTITTEILDLTQFNMEFCDGRPITEYNADTKKMIEMIESADCYIIATPIFQASLTGVLKNLFDLLPVSALRNKVIGFAATGGTYQHYLVVENQLKPIAGYFKSYITPEYVYAHREHFNNRNEVIDTEVAARIQRLGIQIVQMTNALKHVVTAK
ncbi:NADPH-dependent FMN reductase [Halalkalibacter nanhaiisediminis]|uniref:FAD reductase [NAD(P)H] n=1 Tax=Halalkalibacter nanhaiisediminis TaxID=688079 RepID=A0A562QQR5_9BACI|nr:NAD(P)H-dependent oxidoreductase [Halalkalibacter nanhaiisediminis]TWI59098.1 FAD reductase [NAD(P)H] [Halalkalibacter nanhaiisediminis]